MDVIATLNAALGGHYRLDREIGSGGMATVYLAEDLKHHRQVAMKVLRQDLATTLGADRFLREIEIAAQLQHPHILPLLDSGEADGLVFFVMPYLDGGTLAKRLGREGELPIADALRILIGIVDALAHAHEHGVVHRDVKPENVMISGRHPLVTDFGVAKALSDASEHVDLTTIGVALGTPTYMSPEQAAADPHVDHRSDLYSVGVVAYEMLTGHPPFRDSTPQQLLAAHVTQAPLPVTRFRPGVTPELEGIVMRCLEKRAANRFQTADELLARLEGLVTPSGGTAPTSARLPAVASPKRRGRWIPASLAMAALAVAALVFGWIPLPGGGPGPLPTLGQSLRVTVGDGLATHVTVSPDGTLVAYAAGQAQRMRVYIQPVGGGRVITLSEDSTALEYAPQWSPDGSQIGYLTPGGLRVASALGGASRLVAGDSDLEGASISLEAVGGGNDPPVHGFAWSPDGSRLFASRGSAGFIIPLDGGPETHLGGADAELHSCAWSPTGEWVACTSGNGEAVIPGTSFGNLAPSIIVLIDPVEGTMKALMPRSSSNGSPVWAPDGRRLFFTSNRNGPRDIYVIDLDGDGEPFEAPRRITTGLGAISISLSADGTELVYVEYSARANLWSLPIPDEAVSASTSGQLTSGDQVIESAMVSPDGEWILFDSNLYGDAEIFRMPVEGGTPERLTNHPGDDFAPTLSPDGTSFAFHSWRTGSRDIFVQPIEGQPVQLTFTDSQESYPVWSADGRSIFFYDQLIENGILRGLHQVDREGDGWGEPILLLPQATTAMPFSGDSIVFGIRPGSIVVAQRDGTGRRTVYAPRPGSADPVSIRTVIPSADGQSIYFKGRLAEGRRGVWSVPIEGGQPRLLVDFDDPDRPSIRPDFGAGAGQFFFTMEERRSTVWVVELLDG